MEHPEESQGSRLVGSCCNCLGCLLIAVVAAVLWAGQMIMLGAFFGWIFRW